MTYQEIAELLASVGIPTAYYQFPEDTGQEPPFICFYYGPSADMYADDSNYQKIDNLSIELYTDNKDFDLEKRLETVLKGADLTWTREETYIDTERMYEVIYSVEVIIKEEN